MTEVYRHVDADGKVTFSDSLPPSPGKVDVVQPGRPSLRKSDEDVRREHQDTVKYIKEVQKRVPKLLDYLEYAEYLRNHSPFKLERVLLELKDEDPQTWLKLQKYPQFRPLHNTALGLKAADKHIAAGIGFASGSITGSVEKWLDTTVKDMMKRDRFGPYANVLRTETKPLNAKPPTYSNSRFGQYLKGEDARLEKSAVTSAKALEASRGAKRFAKVTLVSRGGGAVFGVGLEALKRENGVAVTDKVMRDRLERVARRNQNIDIDTAAYEEARRLLSQGEYGVLDQYLKRFE